MQRSTFTVALTLLFAIATFVIFLPIPKSQTLKQSGGQFVLGSRTKSLNCRVSHSLPDPDCTPGDVITALTSADICQPGFSPPAEVSAGLANQVYLQYGIISPEPGQYQIDRLVSENLGGSNDISNLWPQPKESRPGYHEKDRVERYLHDRVCSGEITLIQAQTSLASDWLRVFLSMPSY